MPTKKISRGTPAEPGIAPQEYNAFVTRLELDGLRLSRLEVDAPHAYVSGRQLTPHTAISSAEYVRAENGFVVTSELRFEGRYEGDAEPVVRIVARFEISYSTGLAITDEIFQIFRDTSLPLNIWPYFRELVHTALARVEWPVLVLPVYKGLNKPVK
jgi:hypothetical protein